MNVQARFCLSQVNRAQGYYKAPDEQEAVSVESAYVILNGVQGDPFGAATPSAKLEMLIVNPTAAAVFFNAPIGQEFDVLFTFRENEVADGSI